MKQYTSDAINYETLTEPEARGITKHLHFPFVFELLQLLHTIIKRAAIIIKLANKCKAAVDAHHFLLPNLLVSPIKNMLMYKCIQVRMYVSVRIV